MQYMQGQTHNLPERWYNTLTTNRVENVWAHSPDTNKRRAGILRMPSPFTPLTVSQENQDYSPLLYPPLPRRQARRKHKKGKSVALPSRDGSASTQPPGAPLYQNINFPEIRRHYATAAGGAQTSPVYVPARERCNQSSHLKVASPLQTRQQKFM